MIGPTKKLCESQYHVLSMCAKSLTTLMVKDFDRETTLSTKIVGRAVTKLCKLGHIRQVKLPGTNARGYEITPRGQTRWSAELRLRAQQPFVEVFG